MSRSAVENELFHILDTITQSTDNSKRYKELFKTMSNTEFNGFFNDIKNGTRKLPVFFPHHGNAKMELGVLLKEADRLGLRFFDTIERDIDGIEVTSYQQVMILKVAVRRLAQTLDAKMSIAEEDGRTDAITGQVTSDSKAASISGVELGVLNDAELPRTAAELATVRGGDSGAYAYLKASTTSTGEATLAGAMDFRTGVGSKRAVSIFLLGKHIGTNL